jgi:UDP-glucose 4-epimerase
MNILVTGGAGFIGSHVADRFLADGHKVTVVDLWESDEIKVHRDNANFTFVKADVTDDKTMDKCVSGKDSVIHMAAVLGTSETITTYDVEKTAFTNVVGTVKMLKHCKKHGVKRVLIPTTPDVPWINPYKITKQAVENFGRLFSKEFGLEVVALKLGNIYGARERWLDGPKEAPYNYQKIVPTILMEALKGNKFQIFGNGDQKSEYIYVDDVVQSFALALESKRDLSGEIIHVGRGQNNSVHEIIAAVEKAWGRKVEVEYVDMRPGEIHIEIALDPTNLNKLLDYELQWGLQEGLVETIKYYEEMYRKHYV